MELIENSKAPDFKAYDQNNKIHHLKDYLGKWILLYFYPKDNTPGCTMEACQLRDHFDELREKMEVIGVSHDKVESHARFASKYKLPYTLLSDPDKEIIKVYGAKGFLFTKRISYLINPEGKIAKIYLNVSPKKHAKEILKDFENLTR